MSTNLILDQPMRRKMILRQHCIFLVLIISLVIGRPVPAWGFGPAIQMTAAIVFLLAGALFVRAVWQYERCPEPLTAADKKLVSAMATTYVVLFVAIFLVIALSVRTSKAWLGFVVISIGLVSILVWERRKRKRKRW